MRFAAYSTRRGRSAGIGMNGGQDLGGMHGFGPVKAEDNEPVFHAPWEARAFALTLAMGASGRWNLDESRHARESMPPAAYLSSSYYQIWLAGLEKLMIRHGLVSEEELDSGQLQKPGADVRCLQPDQVASVLARGAPVERPAPAEPRFPVGSAVHTKNVHPATHTRLPRYARGRRGVIHAVHGCHVFADSHADTGDENPQWLYSVRFDAEELWGTDTSASDVFVDCWESYLTSDDNG